MPKYDTPPTVRRVNFPPKIDFSKVNYIYNKNYTNNKHNKNYNSYETNVP